MTQPRGWDRNPPQGPSDSAKPSLNSHYGSSSSNGEARRRRRRVHIEDLKNFRVEAPKLGGKLKPEDYLEWVQSKKIIIEIKGYLGEMAFKLVVLKLK